MTLARNQQVRWTISESEDDQPVSYYCTVLAVLKNRVVLDIKQVGMVTTLVTDGTFEPITQLQPNPIIEQTVESTPVKSTRELPVGGQRKSDQVRAAIALAKKHNQSPATVIEWAVANLGMPRGQARVYVDGNWNRV